MTVVFNRMTIVFSRMKIVFSRMKIVLRSVERNSYDLQYVLTRLNTTFIRLSYDSHTPEHEIHTFVIRSEEPIT